MEHYYPESDLVYYNALCWRHNAYIKTGFYEPAFDDDAQLYFDFMED